MHWFSISASTMESKLLDWSHLLLLLFLVSLHGCSHAQSGTTSTPPLGLSLRDSLKASFSLIVVAFLSAFVLMGFFSLYLRHCTQTYVYSRNPIAAAADLLRGRLHREVINKCPILAYSAVKHLKIGKSDLDCAVCLGEFQDKDKIRLLPKCRHVFHPDCIDAWFISNLTCPVCRASITPSDCEDNAVVVPTATNPDESPTASGEVEQRTTVESLEPPAETIDVDESGSSSDPLTQTTPPIQSRMTERFPRSHSTGHSLVMEPEEVMERYTMRLPEHVREKILGSHRGIRRSHSSDVVLEGVWSSKRGSDNLERWVLFSMAKPPPFGSMDWSSVKSTNQNAESSLRRPPV